MQRFHFGSILPSILLSVIVVAAVGCGRPSGISRAVVSGTVTLDGDPVGEGQIRYVPIEGTPGPMTMARIIDGRYVCDDRGGVPVGKHRVEVLAWDPKLPAGGRGEPSRPQLIPEKYNGKSELVETVDGRVAKLEKNFAL